MKLASDFSLIDDPEADTHDCYPFFEQAMEGRAYGRDALNDAWLWFKAGWNALNNALTDACKP